MIIQRDTYSVEQTYGLAREVAHLLLPRDLLALRGELGAGKTCFVRGLAAALGIDPGAVSSPTFVIAKEYQQGGPHGSPADSPGSRLTLIHIDAYRLSGSEELETIPWDEMLGRDDAIMAVEWADRVAGAFPPLRTVWIEIEHAGEDSRHFRFEVPPTKGERFKALRPRARTCSTCGRTVTIDNPHFPFCSERCQMADLNEWFEERYSISRPIDSSDELTD